MDATDKNAVGTKPVVSSHAKLTRFIENQYDTIVNCCNHLHTSNAKTMVWWRINQYSSHCGLQNNRQQILCSYCLMPSNHAIERVDEDIDTSGLSYLNYYVIVMFSYIKVLDTHGYALAMSGSGLTTIEQLQDLFALHFVY